MRAYHNAWCVSPHPYPHKPVRQNAPSHPVAGAFGAANGPEVLAAEAGQDPGRRKAPQAGDPDEGQLVDSGGRVDFPVIAFAAKTNRVG
jgi:hypothetical protein